MTLKDSAGDEASSPPVCLLSLSAVSSSLRVPEGRREHIVSFAVLFGVAVQRSG